MDIRNLPLEEENISDEKARKNYRELSQLLQLLRETELSEHVILTINEEVKGIEGLSPQDKGFRSGVKKAKSAIFKILVKDARLVPRNYYRNQWTGLGMTVFGLPLGLAIGFGTNNGAFLAVGVAMGMAIGVAVGNSMDKKAEEEGRQLDIE